MILDEYFAGLLEDTVNLNASRIRILDERVEAVTRFLEGHSTLSGLFRDVIPQGSYAHRTIIKPLPGKEFDADVLLWLDENQEWVPADYVKELLAVFKSSGTYESMVSAKTRCVTVDYANEFHIDVVPYLVGGDCQWITNSRENALEVTNPEGFNQWLDARDAATAGNLVPTIRLVKYLRDHKRTFSIKSVILTTLLAQQIDPQYPPPSGASIAETLVSVMESLDAWLDDKPGLPEIVDPSCAGVNFGDRWDQDHYRVFRTKVKDYAGWMRDALDEQDEESSIEKWRRVFGGGFRVASGANSMRTLEASANAALRDREEDLVRDRGIPIALSGALLRVGAQVRGRKGMGRYELSKRGHKVAPGRRIEFRIAACNVPEPYEVLWKIKNHGEAAARADCMRGEIVTDDGSRTREESTAYPGHHWVECYVVRNGVCVARARHSVIVTSS